MNITLPCIFALISILTGCVFMITTCTIIAVSFIFFNKRKKK